MERGGGGGTEGERERVNGGRGWNDGRGREEGRR